MNEVMRQLLQDLDTLYTTDLPLGRIHSIVMRARLALTCPLTEAAPELLRVLDLIVMEFKSDPMSVQCFDLRLVEEAKAIVAKAQDPHR